MGDTQFIIALREEEKRLEDVISKAKDDLAKIQSLLNNRTGSNGSSSSNGRRDLKDLNVRAGVRQLVEDWKGRKYTSNDLYDALKGVKKSTNEMAMKNNIAVALKRLYSEKKIDRRNISTNNLEKYEYWWIGTSS